MVRTDIFSRVFSRILVQLLFLSLVGCSTTSREVHSKNLLSFYSAEYRKSGALGFIENFLEDYEFQRTLLKKLESRDKPWVLFGCKLLSELDGKNRKKLLRKLIRGISRRKTARNPREILYESCKFDFNIH